MPVSPSLFKHMSSPRIPYNSETLTADNDHHGGTCGLSHRSRRFSGGRAVNGKIQSGSSRTRQRQGHHGSTGAETRLRRPLSPQAGPGCSTLSPSVFECSVLPLAADPLLSSARRKALADGPPHQRCRRSLSEGRQPRLDHSPTAFAEALTASADASPPAFSPVRVPSAARVRPSRAAITGESLASHPVSSPRRPRRTPVRKSSSNDRAVKHTLEAALHVAALPNGTSSRAGDHAFATLRGHVADQAAVHGERLENRPVAADHTWSSHREWPPRRLASFKTDDALNLPNGVDPGPQLALQARLRCPPVCRSVSCFALR